MTVLMSADQFRGELRAKHKPVGGVYRVSLAPPAPVIGAERTLRFCFSDESVDRMGDTIAAAGWDIADFQANPVALWAHDSSAPPIGGARNVGVEDNRLLGDIEFAPPETYAFADTIYRLVLGKFLRAVSVGFMPTRYNFVENDPERGFGIDFLEQSLLEISVCPVPANPNALQEARRKGIDTRPLMEWAERTLDGDGRASLPRAELERLRRAAKETPMTRPTPRRSAARPPNGRRSDGTAEETDPSAGSAALANCGRKADEECGMTDPCECSVHAGVLADLDSEEAKRLAGLLRRLLPRRKEAGDPDDDLPVEHEDAIRVAHKCLRTSKAFLTEAVSQHSKAIDLLGGVVDALDAADPISTTAPDTDPDAPDGDKAAQLLRAAAAKRRLAGT
jgi:HK97 family phage prohead protease